MTAIVALTAQNTVGVTAVHEVPAAFVVAQLEAVFSDIGVDAAKTGMLFSGRSSRRSPACSPDDGAARRRPGAGRLVGREAAAGRRGRGARARCIFPLATVVTPNLLEARTLTGARRGRAQRARRAARRAGRAGGDRHGRSRRRRRRPSVRRPRRISRSRSSGSTAARRMGPGCTHSATLAALLARGAAARRRARGLPRAAAARGSERAAPSSARATARSTSST